MAELNIEYEAAPIISQFHASDAVVRGLMGPVGCVAGDTLIFTEHGLIPIEDIDRPMRVLSRNERTGQFQLSVCGGSFPKGRDFLYRVTTQQGEFVAAGHHLTLCADGSYRRVDTLSQGQILSQCSNGPFLTKVASFGIGSLEDDPRYMKTGVDYLGNYAALARQNGQQFLREKYIDPASVPLQAGAQKSISSFDLSADEHTDGQMARSPKHSRHGLFGGQRQTDDSCSPAGLLHLNAGDFFGASLFSHIAESIRQFQRSLLMTVDRLKARLFSLYYRSFLCSKPKGAIISIEQLSIKQPFWDMQVADTNNYVSADGAIHHNSGKSVACCLEIFYRAISQRPNKHGIRKTRIAVVRNTYPELKTTTIKTWQDWFPESVCPISWGSPITGNLRLPLPDGTKVEAEILFMPLDKPADVKKLLSLELTMGWINEAREIPKEIVDGMTMRIGRYPAKRDGGPTWVGVFMDTNPPDDDHWWYNMCEIECPKGWDFFRQPGALIKQGEHWLPNPEAENAHHQPLGYQYWLNMVPGKSLDWINVYVLGNYGTVQDGKPIYPEFNDQRHVAKEPLEPYKGIPLRLGWDFGLTPACAFFQVTPKGQIRVLDECVSADMGIRRFIKEMVRPMLTNKYAGMPIISFGDPAGNQRSQTSEDTCLQILGEEGIPTEGAYTQEYIARRESVASFLTSTDIDGDPGLLLSPTCKVLRKGFNGAYKYERIQLSGEARYRDKPSKTLSSHIHEGLQYGVMEVIKGRTQRSNPRRQIQRRSAAGWT